MVLFPSRLRYREFLSIAILLFLLFALGGSLYLSQRPQEIRKKAAESLTHKTLPSFPEPEMVKGEVIVKTKNQKQAISLKNNASLDIQDNLSFGEVDLEKTSPIFKKINEKYPIKQVAKVFKGTGTPESNLNALKQRSSILAKKINQTDFLKIDISHTYKLTFDPEVSVNTVIDELLSSPEIEYAESNYIFKASGLPNDPYYLDHYPDNVGSRDPSWNPNYDYQWNLKKIQMDGAWNIATSSGMITAVVDTGIDYTHAELGSCTLQQVDSNQCQFISPGYDFINNDSDPLDDNGHGTHVSGIITSVTNNSFGIAGINWANKIMPVKVLDYQGSGSLEAVAAGIRYAVNNGAAILNMSLGISTPLPTIPQTLKDALDYAFYAGRVIVVASGNDNKDVYTGFWPAKYKYVISVASTDENDQKASYSNYGKIEVVAPGGGLPYNVLSLNAHGPAGAYLSLGGMPVGDGFLRLSGTSMASPHVAGLASLLLSRRLDLSNLEVKTTLEHYSDDLGATGRDDTFGWGRINAKKVLEAEQVPPVGELYLPEKNDSLGGIYTVRGTVGGRSFQSYVLEMGFGENPTSWGTDGITLTNNGTLPITNDSLATVNVSSYQKGVYTLRLKVLGNNNLLTERRVFVSVDPDLRPGWPKDLDGKSAGVTDESYFVASDIDNNGQKEIISGSTNGYLYIWNINGELRSGFPKYMGGNAGGALDSVPAVVDLDRDGIKEIAAKSYFHDCQGFVCTESYNLNLLTPNGEQVNSSWPRQGDYTNPILEDMNNDNTLEIVSFNKLDGKLYVFAKDGASMNYNLSNGGSGFMSIGDLDGNGIKETVFVKDNMVLVYNNTGSLIWQKSVELPETSEQDASWAKPTLADVNNDGQLEIVVPSASTLSNSDRGKVFVFKADGNNLEGWPQSSFTTEGLINRSSVAVGDIDNNGTIELVWGTNRGRVMIYKANGGIENILYGDSVYSNFNRGIVLGDINNDSKPEILVGASNKMSSSDGGFFAFDYQGNRIVNWPKSPFIFSTPQITDIDNDGKVEIIALGKENISVNDKIYIWGLNSQHNSNYVDWPLYGFNERRTSKWDIPRINNTPTPTLSYTPTPTSLPRPTPPIIENPGKALYFGDAPNTGPNGNILTFNNSDLDFSGDFSFESWVKPERIVSVPETYKTMMLLRYGPYRVGNMDDSFYFLVNKTQSYGQTEYDLVFVVHQDDGYFKNVRYIIPTERIVNSEWMHVGITSSNKNLKLYVDGELQSQTSYQSIMKKPGSYFVIGGVYVKNTNNTEYVTDQFYGVLDDLRFSNIARNIEGNWSSDSYYYPLTLDRNTIDYFKFEDNLNNSGSSGRNAESHGQISYTLGIVSLQPPTTPAPTITLTPTIRPTSTPAPSPTPRPTVTPTPTPQIKNLTLRVTSGLNDGYQMGSGQSIADSSQIKMGWYTYAAGFRFTGSNLSLLKGKTIKNATLSFYSAQNTTSAIRLRLYAQKTGLCSQFNSNPYDLSNRVLSSNNRQWIPAKWTVGSKINSPNITSVIQEIVSRNDFTGSSLCILVKEEGSDKWSERTVFSYDGNQSLSPSLSISYY